MKNEQKPDTTHFKKYQKNPVLEGLPHYLKDPKNYKKIKKEILETLASAHSHGDMLEWSNCFPCQQKMREHGLLIRSLGFQSPAQYYAWNKIHQVIERRDPLI